MKKLALIILFTFTVALLKAQSSLDKTYTSSTGSFLIQYPSNWSLDELATNSYLIKISKTEDKASIAVKRTEVGSAVDAKTVVTKYIEPAWLKADATLIPLTEEQKLMTSSQVAVKNISSGYSTIVKSFKNGEPFYIGYIVMVKGLIIYEIKYEAYGSTSKETVNLLSKIGFSFRAL